MRDEGWREEETHRPGGLWSLLQPFPNHFCGDFVAGLGGVAAADVGGGDDGEVSFGGKPHDGVPHRVAAVVHEGWAAGPRAIEDDPTAGVVFSGRWRV